MKIKNYIAGQWIAGANDGETLYNAVDGTEVALASTKGIDMSEALAYGRVKGEALRRMTFQQRGLMLKSLALYLLKQKDKYYEESYKTGATKMDSWIDIEGGIGNLFANASLRRKFGDQPFYIEGESVPLSREGTFIGHHILVPKQGIAVHINAFNFPIWGMLEKIAVNLLAGMPAIVKPATVTSFLTHKVVEDIIASEILPEGSLQLVCGSARDLLDGIMYQDVVTFTGSAETGRKLKSHPKILSEAVPFNMEADSLNAIVLGKDVKENSKDFEIFIREIKREITAKCGQKCTAIRRVIVPDDKVDVVIEKLGSLLDKLVIGDPRNNRVKMGALAGHKQKEEVQSQLSKLINVSSLAYHNENIPIVGASIETGAFMRPQVLVANDPIGSHIVHEVEVFGPVCSILPYKSTDDAIKIVKMGKGSLVSTIVSSDPNIVREYVYDAAAHHGRIHILNNESAKESTGHGSPMPLLVHGGPGRAGGGEEMGGIRGVKHYMQRCALQGSPTLITEVGNIYEANAKKRYTDIHPFRKHFEELSIGETWQTHKHTVTEADIVNFANLSGDHFYAHTDVTSLNDTPFEGRVAHGYYILSKAAGMFVDAKKGPVLLNYGIDSCRFTKPVYPGTTIAVELTVKEKIIQEKRDDTDVRKGIVKWHVEVTDNDSDLVALVEILTMVKSKNQE